MNRFDAPEPAYETFPLVEPERRRPPDPLEGIWGRLDIEATVVRHVHIGSGGWAVVGGDRPQLAAATVTQPEPRSDRVPAPCIPGSSLKGALRVVVEALSPSCDPLEERRCKGAELCPACTVFGLAGRRGLVSPGELEPAGDCKVALVRIPQRYSHPGAPRRGRRLYRLEPEASTAGTDELIEVLREGSVLRGEIALRGVPDWGAGLLTIALGVGPMGLPLLRIGGGKNRGLGALAVRVTGGWWATGPVAALGAPARVSPPVEGGTASASHPGAGQGPDEKAIGTWQSAAARRFPDLSTVRDRIARLYGAGQP
jgi:hypothetical protein